MRIYNTLTRAIDEFKPLKPGAVSMYHCGPTVYDTPHIGNYRTFVMNDLIRRSFARLGYEVAQTMNITDVDDKTIRRSREEGLPLDAVTRRYEALFLEGLASLNVLLPHHLTRATEYIADMIALTSTLLDKGVAYKAADGVYLSIGKVPRYGQLAKLDLSKDRAESRIANDEYDKEDPHDFALWKFKTPEDGDVSWPAPFGAGRPGWHIECSAMAMKTLGETIDIHTGGSDLVFPHHTNEIAQSECATGKSFANYWMHGAFMTVNGEKMSKSKGNIIKLEDLRDGAVSPLAYRYWLMTAHYRTPVNFTYEAVRAAQSALIRLMETVSSYPEGGSIATAYADRFTAHLEADLDLPKAIALVWEIIKDSAVSAADKRATILSFDDVFGLKLASVPVIAAAEAPLEVRALADARQEARAAKDWQKSDALRAEIMSRGFEVLDGPGGYELREI